jgi:hypothetical protein
MQVNKTLVNSSSCIYRLATVSYKTGCLFERLIRVVSKALFFIFASPKLHKFSLNQVSQNLLKENKKWYKKFG